MKTSVVSESMTCVTGLASFGDLHIDEGMGTVGAEICKPLTPALLDFLLLCIAGRKRSGDSDRSDTASL